jgi:hypothetical protein
MVGLGEFENVAEEVVLPILRYFPEDLLRLRKTTKTARTAGWTLPEYKSIVVASPANLFGALSQSRACWYVL